MVPVGSSRCPHCASPALLDAPVPFGLASRQACARPLFYLTLGDKLTFFRHVDAPFARRLFDGLPHSRLVPPNRVLDGLNLDSLDMVELIVDLQTALDAAAA